MDSQESILASIQQIEKEIETLAKYRQALIKRLDVLYYVANISLDAPLIICHGTEAYCKQYMLDNYPDGFWYSDGNQFSPIHNPKNINWAILHSVTKAEKRSWNRIQAYIESPNQDTQWEIIAMLRGD